MGKNTVKSPGNGWRFSHVAAAIAVLAVAGIFLVRSLESKSFVSSEDLESLALCLTDKGVRLYGAEWCSHCQKQKKAFGAAESLIDYVECVDSADPRKQADACESAGIDRYPTWVFSPVDRVSGVMPFSDIAARAGCPWGEMADPAAVSVGSGL